LATPPTPQRAWRAACPNCGAPVEFRSAASASAVCGYCRSTLVREGEALRRIGESAELFDDHSPLQLGAGGRFQGVAFTLVGRLQYAYADGTWNEWHALFDGGRSGWLSEDNGRYVFAFDAPLTGEVPAAGELVAGDKRLVAGAVWDVASVTRARLIAAQGELPFAPRLEGEFTVADLRNVQGEVGSLDYSDEQAPHWSIGRSVALSELAMQGLRETSEKSLSARGLACPSCGNALEITLDSTQSIVCGQCKAVVDVSRGVGGDLAHYRQDNAQEPLIPLGKTGEIALGTPRPLPWQVVGYMERCDIPEEEGEEQSFWREYLLYHRQEGFAFLVDTSEGWSWVRPLTGVPQVRGDTATWGGVSYRRRWHYTAQVTYVLGEFYWQVRRHERALVTDYEAGKKRLSREQSASEVTWSAGEALDAEVVGRAFGVPLAGLKRDVGPLTPPGARGTLRVVLIFFAIIVLLFVLARCGGDDCDEVRATFGAASQEYQQCQRSGGSGFRTSGGSFGGFSSGGGHK
jgi:hypothetical protein